MQWGKWVQAIVGLCILVALTSVPVVAQMQASDGLWAGAFNNHGSIMLLVETESGKIVNANEAAASFYGYSVEQLKSMYIDKIHMYTPEEVAQE
ncbi:MAG TPA: hypothetical protein DDZ66_06805, partial [Firmicutes bacterium]|nr:hypothetical protein [Bacillota bacterium]